MTLYFIRTHSNPATPLIVAILATDFDVSDQDIHKPKVVVGILNEHSTQKFEIALEISDENGHENLLEYIKSTTPFQKIVVTSAGSMEPDKLFILSKSLRGDTVRQQDCSLSDVMYFHTLHSMQKKRFVLLQEFDTSEFLFAIICIIFLFSR